MDAVLEKLIKELTETTTLDKKTIIKLYEQELENCGDAETAAHKVRRRIDFYII